MFTLEIKRADDSIYWTEVFPTEADAQAWVNEESTRDYWDNTFTYTIVEIPERVESAEEAAARVALDQKKAELAALDPNSLTNINEMRDALIKVLEVLGLRT
jgi:disulfide oxidoreductase YuzD